MAEKPILFSGEMVRAILDGRKTQTRRVIKPQPPENAQIVRLNDETTLVKKLVNKLTWFEEEGGDLWPCHWDDAIKCPFEVGQHRWIREKFNAKSLSGKWWHEVPKDERPLHNWAYTNPVYPAYEEQPPRWFPSIHMPKDASRITLRVTDVRVERVQDISREDARAEGCEPSHDPYLHAYFNELVNFSELWDSINAKRGFGWDANPWVWVVEFSLLDQNGQPMA